MTIIIQLIHGVMKVMNRVVTIRIDDDDALNTWTWAGDMMMIIVTNGIGDDSRSDDDG